MSKRLFSILAAGALIASLFSAVPVTAQESAPEVPAEPNIVDPRGDGNGHSFVSGQSGPVSIGASDYLAVWFTNDQDNLYVHVQTVFPGFSGGSIWYSIYVDPGVGDDCAEFRGFTEHQAVAARGQLRVTGDCGDVIEDVEMVTQEGPEEEGRATGIHTITVPRSLTDHLADGKVLSIPNALSRYFAGTDATGGVGVWVIDNTEEGTAYTITSGEGDTKAQPPGKNDPPGQGNQKCSKIKNKKKKKECKKNSGKQKGKNKNKPTACADFAPGERGAEVEYPTAIVTDEHTEEAPFEQTVTLDASAADAWIPGWVGGPSPGPTAVSADPFNIQVRTKNGDAGLWALFEFPDRRDYDIDLFHTDGSYAARSRAFNPAAELSSSGHGGEHGTNYEKLLGIRTQNCGGWTAEASNHFGEGGEFTLKLWLGPAETDPLAPGEETP